MLDVAAGPTALRLLVDRRARLRQAGFGPTATAQPLDPAVPTGLYPLAYPAYDEDPRRAPALRITHADGTTSTRLHVDDVEHVAHGDGRAEHTVHLVDEAQPLGVALRFRTHEDEGVLEQWVEVTNRQAGPIRLHEAASASPSFLAGDTWLTHFGGDWAAEWTPTTEALTLGSKVLETRGGIRPHLQVSPYFLLDPDGVSTETAGTVLVGALAWGGDLRFAFERTATRQLPRAAAGTTSPRATTCSTRARPSAARRWCGRGPTRAGASSPAASTAGPADTSCATASAAGRSSPTTGRPRRSTSTRPASSA